MKKITAMLLALVMMTLPMLGLAESPAEMLEAAAATRPMKTDVQLDFGSFPGLDEETATLINDVVDALGFTYVAQEDQGSFALQLSGTDVLTFAAATADQDTYINSNLLGGTVAFNEAEGQVILDYLMKLAVESGMMTEADLAEVKAAIDQAAAQVAAPVESVNVEDMDLTGIMTVVTDLMAKVTTAEVTQQPKNCDAATTMITLTLTGEDIAKLYNAFFDVLKGMPQFMESLNSMELTMDGQPVTAEEFVAKLPELTAQMAEMVQGDIPVEMYMNDAGELVYATAAVTMKGENEDGSELTIAMDMNYARLTVNEAVTHTVNVIAQDNANEGVSISVNVSESEKLDVVNVAVASIADGAAKPVVTVDVKTEKEYGETESEEDMDIAVAIIDSDTEEEFSIQLDIESEAKKVGEDVTYEADIDLHIMGLEEELLCIKTTQTTGIAAESIVAADAVRPGQMTEEEFTTYINEDVMNAAMNALMGLVQNLPASVLSLLMGE